jgi:hypothetical protein
MNPMQWPIIRWKHLNQGQGLAEYSLIISLVALICVCVLVVIGRTTTSAIQKVTCAIGSTDPQCSCENEKLTVSSAFPNGCSGTTLIVSVESNCPSAIVSVNGVSQNNPGNFSWSNAPVCTGGATSFVVTSTLPNGTVKNYAASHP